jgi:hypothetical protein
VDIHLGVHTVSYRSVNSHVEFLSCEYIILSVAFPPTLLPISVQRDHDLHMLWTFSHCMWQTGLHSPIPLLTWQWIRTKNFSDRLACVFFFKYFFTELCTHHLKVANADESFVMWWETMHNAASAVLIFRACAMTVSRIFLVVNEMSYVCRSQWQQRSNEVPCTEWEWWAFIHQQHLLDIKGPCSHAPFLRVGRTI